MAIKEQVITDIDAERYSVAGLLKYPMLYAEISNFISENDYASKGKINRTCFSAIKDAIVAGEAVSPYLIALKINNLGISFEELGVGGDILGYLEELKLISISEKDTMSFFKRLKIVTARREIDKTAKNISKAMHDAVDQPLDKIVTMADEIYSGRMSLFVKESDQEFAKIFDTIQQVMEERAENPVTEFGYFGPFKRYNHLYDAAFSPGDINLTASRSNVGKAQNVNCKVMTPKGWVKIGDIKVGDFVIGSDGYSKEVIGVYPQGVKKSFEIIMDDGGKTYSCDEHLWLTHTYKNRKNKRDKEPTVKTLQQIKETLVDNHGGSNHGIPFVKPISFEEKKLPLHPYLLGILIGDGCLVDKKSTTFTSADSEIVDKVSKLLSESEDIKPVGAGDKYSYRIIKRGFKAEGNFTNPQSSYTQIALRELGLHGLKSFEKFIPAEYKLGAVWQRIALLQGLMDTDGNIDKDRPSVTFNSTSKRLAEDVREVAWSLGARASLKSRENTYYIKDGKKVFCKTLWRVYITFQVESGINPFSLKRKADRFTGGKKKKYRYIKSIERVGDAESVCIKIKSHDSLYITDDFILTHNTSFGFFVSTHVAATYNVPLLWLDSGEMLEFQMQTRAICSLSKGRIPTYYLKTGLWKKNPEMVKAYNEVMPMVEKLKKLFFFKNVGGMNSKEICSTVRRFWLAEVGRFADLPTFGSKLGGCFPTNYDYLKGLPSDNPNSPEWAEMGYHMQDLKNLMTNEVPAAINTYLQLNKTGITRGKKAGGFDDSEGAFSMSDRIYHNVSRADILRFKTMDELALENEKFGNCVLKNCKRRDLGKGFQEALKPVRMPDGSLQENYIHLNQDSFYWEEKGDLIQSAEELGQVYSHDAQDGDESDANIILR